MKRYLHRAISDDLKKKMVFVGGPRQVGKTTLAQSVAPKNHRYLNWDVNSDREFILNEKFPVEKFIIYDEIHKYRNWRNYIKGLFDTTGANKKILVTGSARLDYYRHSGDSLQGRYHYYRLHPLSVRELKIKKQDDFDTLLELGGFPEPFLSGSKRTANRWKRDYRSRVIHEEIPSLEQSQNLSSMELLLMRLPELVGSPLSINSLRQDLKLAHKTVSKWLDIFERMYLIFRLSPFGSNKLRAVKKEQKHYHYNWADIEESGFRFENLVASHLLKWVHHQQDWEGRDLDLCYFRDVDKREVDFIVTENKKPLIAIECKSSKNTVSPHLKYFKERHPEVEAIQVTKNKIQEFISKDNVAVTNWDSFLNRLV